MVKDALGQVGLWMACLRACSSQVTAQAPVDARGQVPAPLDPPPGALVSPLGGAEASPWPEDDAVRILLDALVDEVEDVAGRCAARP